MSNKSKMKFSLPRVSGEPANLVDLLRMRAIEQPARQAYTFLPGEEASKIGLTYGELDKQARAIATMLQSIIASGERVLLLYPPGLDYLAAFFGCLYAKAIAVPAYPPRRNRNLLRIQAIVEDAQITVALTISPLLKRFSPQFAQNPYLAKLRWVSSDTIAEGSESNWQMPEIEADTVAFLQYTSGSTSTPKGVILTHQNLLHNEALIQKAFQQTCESIIVGWLPLYHDMGLIGNVIQPLYVGAQCVLMSPMTFLQRPFLWLEAISRFRATTSGGPNFAYDLCVRKVTQDQKASLDLSSWRVAFNGAEPVRAETLERFAAAFEPCGFRRDAFRPCYGLAEATLLVGGPVDGKTHSVKKVLARALESNRILEACEISEQDDQTASIKSIVSCGLSMPGQQTVIVDPHNLTLCLPNQIGEVWVSGSSVSRGYWGRPEDTKRAFDAHLADTGEGPFLRTGDLGFLQDGELFITGRLKDLIIIRGLNYYPQDIELSVESSHKALRPGCGAAFCVEEAGEDVLVVVQEIDHHQQFEIQDVLASINKAVAEDHQLQVQTIALIKAGTIPKTSSGKLQRYACRDAFLSGSLEIIECWKSPSPSIASAQQTAASLERVEDVEEWLLSKIAAKLGVEASKLDADQPISQYGIDSLEVIELIHAIEENFAVSLPMVNFLQATSIAQIAYETLTRSSAPRIDSDAAVPSDETLTEYPLSKGQQALWFLHHLSPESAAYNIAAAVRIRSEIDGVALMNTIGIIVDRHAALRSTFTAGPRGPVQRIQHGEQSFFQREDASLWTQQYLDERLVELSQRPFNLEQGPLLRVYLFERSENERILLLVVHHIVADFWSLAVIVNEIGLIYSAEKAGKKAALLDHRMSYSDYIRWQERMLASERGDKLWAYWQERLGGELPVLSLPTDRPRPHAQTSRGASHAFRLSEDVSGKLKAISQAHGTTLYTTLLSAFQVLLNRHTSQQDVVVGSLTAGRSRAELSGMVGYFVNPVVQRADLSGDPSFSSFLWRNRQAILSALEHQDYPFALLVERLQPARDPSLSPIFQVMFVLQKSHLLSEEGLASFALGEDGASMRLGDLQLESIALQQRVAQFDLTLVAAEVADHIGASLQYNTDLFDATSMTRMAERFKVMIEAICDDPDRKISTLPILTDEESKLLVEWNKTEAAYQQDCCIHQLFEIQAERRPEAIAVVFEGERLSYGELNRRANHLAHHLRALGVGPEVPVGIFLDRSLEMMIGLLGVLKAGGAYVPLDATLPKERIAYMIEDSGVPVLLAQKRLADRLPESNAIIIFLDSHWETIARRSPDNLSGGVAPDNLAYVIFTSGSTGKPKGVAITHRNVVNFFSGMDEKIGCNDLDVLLALTSISFDISVLELLWPLANGSRVVVIADQSMSGLLGRARRSKQDRQIEFSLFYFAMDDSQADGDKYRLLFEGAKFADRNGFSAVWTPERHFHPFGGLYPNPSVMSSALAAMTERIKIRGGSVVMPLHNPVRVAEEWSLVDNISKGRVGIAFASGWHSDDFVFFPENYADRKEIMMRGIDAVRQLWRGQSISVRGGAGNDLDIKIYPKPIQPDLPVWLTAAGTPDTFIKAGEIGAGVLTHLLGQQLEDVAEKIKLYRESLVRHGHDPKSGHVTLMLHTFIGEDLEQVKEKVRAPFTNYLRSSIGLIAAMIKSLNLPLDLKTMSEKDMQDLLAFAFDRYFETSALFGTQDSCEPMLDNLKQIGVDEVACLIDFGVDTDEALASLNHLARLKDRATRQAARSQYSLSDQAERQSASMMQCTPSLMGMLSLNPDVVESLKPVKTLMLGGEALPPKLAKQALDTLPARLMNMYGPTETTIWSAVHEVAEAGTSIPLGRPIANTQLHILDAHLQTVPLGVVGELYIGGLGVARGYLNRPDLCAERFIPDSFSGHPGARIYKTGDLARYLPDGTVEFLGRMDHQVKMRGLRIELGEIEAALNKHRAVREAVVVAREDTPGDKRLVAYVVPSDETTPSVNALRRHLRENLPDYMIPSAFLTLEKLPQTSNGKVDRKSLPAPDTIHSSSNYAAPQNQIEQTIAKIWQAVLKVDKVGVHDNFFDIGGHSLLMAQVHNQLRQTFKKDLPLIKILEHPTISSLARYLSSEQIEQSSIHQSFDRAQKQRQALKRQKQSAKLSHGAQ